jgi:UDP-glucose 4-epimerase
MKILITGGGGYISKNLIKNYQNKFNVKSISRVDFDLTNTKETKIFFDKNQFDIVIHTAIKGGSRLINDEYKFTYENLLMFDNLLSNKTNFQTLINLGSGAEIHSHQTPYGLSKKIINKLIEKEDNFYNLRIFGIFNENELDTRFIKSCILNCLKNQKIVIHQNKFFDFFYMNDLFAIIDYYITNNFFYKNFDCCYEKKYTLFDIAKYICNLFNKNIDEFIIISDSQLGESYIGNSEVSKDFAFIGLEEGINRVSKILSQNF